MDAKAQDHREGEGAALAFCVAGAFAAVVLLPSTLLLDLKASAGAWAAALACFGAAWLGWRRRSLRLPPGKALAAATAGLAVVLASAGASPYRALGLEDPGVLAALLLAYGLWLAPEAWSRRALAAWRWSTLAVAGYALAQRVGIEPLSAYARAGSLFRAMGTFGNAGYLAAFLCLSWPLFLSWRGGQRTFALVLVWAALFATQSRAGVLALTAQGLLWGIQSWREGLRPSRRLFLVLAVFLGMGLLLFPAQSWLRPTLRWPLWQASWDLWLQRPWLGWGPGSFALAFQDHASPALVQTLAAGGQYAGDPHQVLLAVLCASGLAGLAAFGLAAFLYFKGLAAQTDQDFRPLWLGVAGVLLQSQCDRFLFLPGVLLPLGLGLAAMPRQGRPLPGRLQRPYAALLALLGLALLWQGLAPILDYRAAVGSGLDSQAQAMVPAESVDQLRAAAQGSADPSAYDRLGAGLVGQQSYGEAADAFRQALSLAPSSGRAQNLGNCLMMLGDGAGAEAVFRRAVDMDPRSSDAHFSLGYALFFQKRLTQAVAELDEALRLDPGNANAQTLKRQIMQ